MKKIVYTVLLGDYKLKEPTGINPLWDFLCFTDQNIKSENWEIIKIKSKKDLRKQSRDIKIRPYNYFNYDICLYLDAKFTVRINLDDFIEKNMKKDLTLMKHKKRKCIYKEVDKCIQFKKDKKEILKIQSSRYKKIGVPENVGLYSPGIMLRLNTLEVKNFMELWYDEVKNYSYRDIISFAYIRWKTNMDIYWLPYKKTYNLFK